MPVERVHLFFATSVTANVVDNVTVDLDALAKLQYGQGLVARPWRILRVGALFRAFTVEVVAGSAQHGGGTAKLDFGDGKTWPQVGFSPYYPTVVDRQLSSGWNGSVTFTNSGDFYAFAPADGNDYSPTIWVDLVSDVDPDATDALTGC